MWQRSGFEGNDWFHVQKDGNLNDPVRFWLIYSLSDGFRTQFESADSRTCLPANITVAY